MAARHGLAVMSAGTHPLAAWNRVSHTPNPRYGRITRELQMIGSRNVVCGLHILVELPAGASRVDVMNRLQPFLPLVLALSTSSPSGKASAPVFSAIGSPPTGRCRAPGCRLPSSTKRITTASSTP
jgi:glutamate---cysteine ligase / carboxylate-amine ligase